jgi:two-component system response regulator GlrR
MSERILVIDDDPGMLRLLSMRLGAVGYQVSEAENVEQARARLTVEAPHLVISDVRLPDGDGLALFDEIHAGNPVLPVILLTAHGTIPDAVAATSRGVFSYLTKPFDSQALLDKVTQALALAPPAGDGVAAWNNGIVSRSARMAEMLAQARMVAGRDASVLIQGESGTGRQLLASVIHQASARAGGPFIVVNCGAIPEQLLESELFGHPSGSANGASASRGGLFEVAAKGTLVFDEIDEMPLPLQAMLVRVLQERDVRPTDGGPGIPIDVRIVSTTRQDLDAALGAGRFREDLYYLLNVVRLVVPPLEQRREDIPLLAAQFLAGLAEKYRKNVSGFAPDAMEALVAADWPGNVRQLFNVVEQVCALATAQLIPLTLVQRALRAPTLQSLTYAKAKERFERDYLIQLLKLTDGNVSDAAKLADRNRTKFYSLLQRHALTPGLFRTGAGEIEK